MAKIRLAAALQKAGIASRRKSEEFIFAGKVSVNNLIVKLPQTLVEPGMDEIVFEKKKISFQNNFVYYLLNKPAGLVCSHSPYKGDRSIYSLFSAANTRLFSLGRLDKQSTGLLLITNDGAFCQKIIHPSANLEKEYLVTTKESLTQKGLEQIQKGAHVENSFIVPKKVHKKNNHTLSIVITEGKKHEVRILVSSKNFTIISLHRIRLGSLLLGKLPIGSYRSLTPKEITTLLQERGK